MATETVAAGERVAWVNVNMTIIRHAMGQPARTIATIEDITGRKKAEQTASYHEELLRETGRLAQIGGWVFDVNTGNGTWTEEVARIHDLDSAGSTNLEWELSFFSGESRARIETAVKEAIESGKPYDLELEMVRSQAGGFRRVLRGRPPAEPLLAFSQPAATPD
jgi:PAS domain-containing protein